MDVKKLFKKIIPILEQEYEMPFKINNPASQLEIQKIIKELDLNSTVVNIDIFEFLRYQNGLICTRYGERFVYPSHMIIEEFNKRNSYSKELGFSQINFFPFSDDSSGNYYGYKIEDHIIKDDSVYLWDCIDNQLIFQSDSFEKWLSSRLA